MAFRNLGLRLIWIPNVTNVGLISIAEKCKMLKCLDLQECYIGDKGLAAIGENYTRLEDLNFQCCKSLTNTGLVQLVLGSGGTLKFLGLAACLRQSPSDVSLEDVEIHYKSLETSSLYSEFNHVEGLLSACKVWPLLNSLAKGYLLLKSVKLEFKNMEEKRTDATFTTSRANCISLHLSRLNHLLV